MIHELRNRHGAVVTLTSHGASLMSVCVPNREGRLDDVLLGYRNEADYRRNPDNHGSLVGRFANRIAGACFTIDGIAFQLPANEGRNLLHGGAEGFSRREWQGAEVTTDDGEGIRFSLESKDGDQGFPGAVSVSATYVWSDDNRLIIDFAATTTKPTPFNIASHGYWNLGAAATPDCLDHILSVDADHMLPITPDLIPTGQLDPVERTGFDLRTPVRIGDLLARPSLAAGLDHCWALNRDGLRAVASLTHPPSGRRMTVITDQPGLQVYTGNHFGSGLPGKAGPAYSRHAGVALETQHFPDSPNHPHFPDTILRPETPFSSRTVFAFGVE